MKRMMLAAVAALLCCTMAFAQDSESNKDKKKIKGSGKVITKDYPVQAFDQLQASGIYSLVLTQGNKDEVKIEADDNLQEIFEVSNEGSKLNIKMKRDVNFDSDTKMKVYVTFKKIKAFDLKMVGSTSNEGQLNFDDLSINNKCVGDITLKLTANTINLENKGVGDVKLSGKAEDVTIVNKSVGSISAADFVVQKLNIENTGVGSAEVNAEKEITVKDSFLAKVKNKGAATPKKKVSIK